jgi:septal ring factor EnvC (AmiA/AmiB activator)
MSADDADSTLVSEVKEKTKELEKLLDAYSERLRRMRQRNRELEQEIASFESDLDRLRQWLAERVGDDSD